MPTTGKLPQPPPKTVSPNSPLAGGYIFEEPCLESRSVGSSAHLNAGTVIGHPTVGPSGRLNGQQCKLATLLELWDENWQRVFVGCHVPNPAIAGKAWLSNGASTANLGASIYSSSSSPQKNSSGSLIASHSSSSQGAQSVGSLCSRLPSPPRYQLQETRPIINEAAVQSCNGHSTAMPAATLPQAIYGAPMGTWVHRQYRLLDHAQDKAACTAADTTQETTTNGPATQAPQTSSTQQVAVPEASSRTADLVGRRDSENGTDALMEAAWRWRFARRWHAEQQRNYEGANASCGDKLEDAFQFLQAGGGTGWHHQVGMARTSSTDLSGSLVHSIGTLGSALGGGMLGQEILLDGSYVHSQMAAELGRSSQTGALEATREVNSMNRRAASVLQQQSDLEKQGAEKWSLTCSEPWLAAMLEPVVIDEWGSFKFLVLRLCGRNDKQRIIIRGHNYSTESTLIEDLNRKMLEMSREVGLPLDIVEVMGGGMMEWRRDRDRHLHIHSGYVSGRGGQGKQVSILELLRLASVLTKSVLPPHFKVTVEGI